MFFPYPLYISHSTTPHYRYFCICNPARCSCTCIITLFNWTEQLPTPLRNAEIDQFILNSTWMQSVNHTSSLINLFDWRPASMRLCVCNLAAALQCSCACSYFTVALRWPHAANVYCVIILYHLQEVILLFLVNAPFTFARFSFQNFLDN